MIVRLNSGEEFEWEGTDKTLFKACKEENVKVAYIKMSDAEAGNRAFDFIREMYMDYLFDNMTPRGKVVIRTNNNNKR